MSIEAPDVSWQTQADGARAAVRARAGQGLDLGRSLLALGGVMAIAFLIFVVGLALGVRGQDVAMLALAAATFVVACAPIVVDQARPRHDRHVFITLICVIFILSYVLPVLTMYIPAEGPIDAPAMTGTNMLPGDLIVGQLVVLLSLVVILTVYWMPVGRAIANQLPRPRIEWPLATILALALVMMAIGWPVRIAAGIGAIPAAWGSGVLGTLYKGTIYANVILMLGWIRHRSVFAAVLVLANVILGGLVGLLQGSKTEMLVRPLIIVLTMVLVRRTFPVRWLVAGALALMLLYPSVNFIRELQKEGLTFQQALTSPIETLNSVGRYAQETDASEWFLMGLAATTNRTDSLGAATVLIRDTPSVSPFLYGETLKLVFVAFIPRIIWPEKPIIAIGQFITSTYGSGPQIISNTASTQIGDYYINFGLPGVVFGMALMGLLVRVAHESMLWRGGTAASLLMLTVIIFQLTIAFEQSVGIVYSNIGFAIIPIWMAMLLARFLLPTYVRKTEESPAPPPVTQAQPS